MEPRAPLAGLDGRSAHRPRASDRRTSGRPHSPTPASRPVALHTSDLGRARQTAEIIAAALDVGRADRRRVPGALRRRLGGSHRRGDRRAMAGHARRLAPGRDPLPAGRRDRRCGVRRASTRRWHVARADGLPGMLVTHGGVLRLIATRAGADDRRADPQPRWLLVRVQRSGAGRARAHRPPPRRDRAPRDGVAAPNRTISWSGSGTYTTPNRTISWSGSGTYTTSNRTISWRSGRQIARRARSCARNPHE